MCNKLLSPSFRSVLLPRVFSLLSCLFFTLSLDLLLPLLFFPLLPLLPPVSFFPLPFLSLSPLFPSYLLVSSLCLLFLFLSSSSIFSIFPSSYPSPRLLFLFLSLSHALLFAFCIHLCFQRVLQVPSSRCIIHRSSINTSSSLKA